MTPSDRRLHPLSFLFGLGRAVRNFLAPGILVFFTASTTRWGDWQVWAMLGFIPVVLSALFEYLFFRWRYAADELVVRSGFIFRNERHIPYQRIQNIDAVQNIFHRMLGVAEVRVQTGGGLAPEATMRVLPLEAFEEMRRRVFEEKRAAGAVAPAAESVHPAVETIPVPATVPPKKLVRLSIRDLLLFGLIENRGMVVVGAALGVLWEFGFADALSDRVFGTGSSARGFWGQIARAFFGQGSLPLGKIALGGAAFVALLALVRIFSMGWSIIRLHDFTLARAGNDLSTRYGLFTVVSATVPIHRIQTITIQEGWLHRLFGRVSVRVETAGGLSVGEESSASREWLAPLVRKENLPTILMEIAPEIDPAAIRWNPVHPAAFRRALKAYLIVSAAISLSLVAILQEWTLLLFAALAAWSAFNAKLHVAHLGWALTGGAVHFKSGWLRRLTTTARFAKIQAVATRESPFDRRAGMASVHIDTAGSPAASHRVAIPYLATQTARELHAGLAARAARTAFRW